jgi:hypothetical protein
VERYARGFGYTEKAIEREVMKRAHSKCDFSTTINYFSKMNRALTSHSLGIISYTIIRQIKKMKCGKCEQKKHPCR